MDSKGGLGCSMGLMEGSIFQSGREISYGSSSKEVSIKNEDFPKIMQKLGHFLKRKNDCLKI